MRLGTKGYVQKDGLDYYETFEPAVSFDVIHLIVGKLVSLGTYVQYASSSPAFLNADVDVELCVKWYSVRCMLQTKQKCVRNEAVLQCLLGETEGDIREPWTNSIGTLWLRFQIKDNRFEVFIKIYVNDTVIIRVAIRGISCAQDDLKSLFKLRGLGEWQFFLGAHACKMVTQWFWPIQRDAVEP